MPGTGGNQGRAWWQQQSQSLQRQEFTQSQSELLRSVREWHHKQLSETRNNYLSNGNAGGRVAAYVMPDCSQRVMLRLIRTQ